MPYLYFTHSIFIEKIVYRIEAAGTEKTGCAARWQL